MTRGTLRIYLGAAPGVGKTFAMLGEGRRRAERGTDVVVGFVESHGRPRTAAQLGDLPVVRRRRILHDGVELEEMDLDAILARRPQVVLVDELAHSNVPGSRHAKRWEDVEELLDAGIDVISTVNIAHLESLSDVCEAITGVPQRERVPDAVVRAADQIELVDMTPEALRRRLAHGNIYDPETIDVALANYFRVGNLAALRELALLWVADRVDEALRRYRSVHGIRQPWETRERVVVALTGATGCRRCPAGRARCPAGAGRRPGRWPWPVRRSSVWRWSRSASTCSCRRCCCSSSSRSWPPPPSAVPGRRWPPPRSASCWPTGTSRRRCTSGRSGSRRA